MYDYNPIDQIKSAWTGTSTIFGKIAVVLFYFFIWTQILWGVLLIVNPRSGFECVYDDVSETTAIFMDMLMIGMNWFSFGYFAFAHYHGIKVWNVLGFLALGLTMLGNNSIGLAKLSSVEPDDCTEYMYASLLGQTVVMGGLSVVLVGCALLDAKMSAGTVDESTPILA